MTPVNHIGVKVLIHSDEVWCLFPKRQEENESGASLYKADTVMLKGSGWLLAVC